MLISFPLISWKFRFPSHHHLRLTLVLVHLAISAGWARCDVPTEKVATSPTAVDQETEKLDRSAGEAISQHRYGDAGDCFRGLAALLPVDSEKYSGQLETAASYYLPAGQYDKAFEVGSLMMAVPVAANARPPGFYSEPSIPTDWRGEARWMMAEARRGQHRWSEALALYRLNQETYPRDDGCIQSGASFQRVAMVEGICLENLGKYDEAVKLYWLASKYLSYDGGSPHAMRRLVDLYSATGQIQVLKDALAEQQRDYPNFFRTTYGIEASAILRADQQERFEEFKTNTNFTTFERIMRFRQAAKKKNWNVFLATLQPNTNRSDRREAMAVLETIPEKAVPVLTRALKNAPKNSWLVAALVVCSQTKEPAGDIFEGSPSIQTLDLANDGPRFGSVILELPPIPKGISLPKTLDLHPGLPN